MDKGSNPKRNINEGGIRMFKGFHRNHFVSVICAIIAVGLLSTTVLGANEKIAFVSVLNALPQMSLRSIKRYSHSSALLKLNPEGESKSSIILHLNWAMKEKCLRL